MEMDRVIASAELTQAAFEIAKHDLSGFRSKHDVAPSVKTVHQKVQLVQSNMPILDGIYLSACAQFELVVRELI